MKKKQHPGDRIKKIRTDLGYSQNEMATLLGTFQANFSLIERGRQDMTYDQLTALYKHTKVNIHWLITGEGSELIDSNDTIDKKLDKIIAMLQKSTLTPDQSKPHKQRR